MRGLKGYGLERFEGLDGSDGFEGLAWFEGFEGLGGFEGRAKFAKWASKAFANSGLDENGNVSEL